MTGAPPNDMTRLTHLASDFVCVLRITGRGSLSPFSSPSFWRYFHFAPNFFACGGHQDVHRAAAEPAGAAAESAAAQLATAAALASAATPLEHAAAMTAAILAALPMSLPLSPQPVSAVALVARRSSPTPPFHPLLLPPDAQESSVLWPPCACVGLSAAWRTVPERLASVTRAHGSVTDRMLCCPSVF